MSIFFDMVKYIIEVIMDDFSVVGDYFDRCLDNFVDVTKRYEESNFLLNQEKYHLMVK